LQAYTGLSSGIFYMKAFLPFFLFFIFLGSSLLAQPRPPLPNENYQIEVRSHFGFYLHHHLELERFNAHFPSFEIALQRSTFGRQRWEALYDYPVIGISAFYSDMGGFEEIGEVYAIYPFINFPLNEDVNNRLNFRLGMGLGYLTNKYHPTENYKNFAIGSHLNAAASLYLDYRKTLGSRFTFVAAAGLTHFSNGSTKTPNYGLNIVTAVAGLNWHINRPNAYLDLRFAPILRPFEYDNKKWFSVEVAQSFGTRDMSQQLGKRYYVSNTAFNLLFPLSMKGKAGIGFEFTYDGSDKGVLDKRGQIEGDTLYKNNLDLVKPGVSMIYEMVLSRTSFVFQLGFHLGGAEKSDGIAYQKAGMKYHFTDKVFGTIALTAHGGRADFIGYGMGYRWDYKYYRKKDRKKPSNL
jgi:hypothetical protein